MGMHVQLQTQYLLSLADLSLAELHNVLLLFLKPVKQ